MIETLQLKRNGILKGYVQINIKERIYFAVELSDWDEISMFNIPFTFTTLKDVNGEEFTIGVSANFKLIKLSDIGVVSIHLIRRNSFDIPNDKVSIPVRVHLPLISQFIKFSEDGGRILMNVATKDMKSYYHVSAPNWMNLNTVADCTVMKKIKTPEYQMFKYLDPDGNLLYLPMLKIYNDNYIGLVIEDRLIWVICDRALIMLSQIHKYPDGFIFKLEKFCRHERGE